MEHLPSSASSLSLSLSLSLSRSLSRGRVRALLLRVRSQMLTRQFPESPHTHIASFTFTITFTMPSGGERCSIHHCCRCRQHCEEGGARRHHLHLHWRRRAVLQINFCRHRQRSDQVWPNHNDGAACRGSIVGCARAAA